MKVRALAVLTLIAGTAFADEVFLRGGGRMTGVVVSRDASRVLLEVGAGRVGIPMSRVERIVMSQSALGTYRQRAARLGTSDVEGWLALARWAQQNELPAQAREAYERVLAVDPRNAAANAGVGNVRLGDRWVTNDEANRARGLVQFEGRWVLPGERSAVLAERAAEAEGRRALEEATARAREAEARARAAEANARQAEADAASQPEQVGVPIYGGGMYPPYGGGMYPPYGGVYPPYGGVPGYGPRPRPRPRRDPPPVRVSPAPDHPHPAPSPAARPHGARAEINR